MRKEQEGVSRDSGLGARQVGSKYKGHPLTDWFPPQIKPVRTGLYIVGSDYLSVMAHWDGKQWCYSVRPEVRNAIQDFCWRGVDGQPDSKGYVL